MQKDKNNISALVSKFQNELFCISEVCVSYRPEYKMSARPKVTSSKQIYSLLMGVWDLDKLQYLEQTYLILLNKGNVVLGIFPMSTGGVSCTLIDPKVVFSVALKGNASNIILAHNHPSGNLSPSQADLSITKKILKGGNLLDIELLDHLIVTSEGYLSFADDGLMDC